MTEQQIESISVAEIKRHFADVLGAVRYRGERFIIERNGTPMAALVPISDVRAEPSSPKGFLALVGEFADSPEFSDTVLDAFRSRRSQRSGEAPELG